MSLTQQWLRDKTASYTASDRVYSDIDAALARFPVLHPKLDVYIFDDGRSHLLLCVHGLLPIVYRTVSYNIPIAVWITRDYPRHPPIVYVVPSADLLVKAGRHIDVSGRCNLEYTQNWERKSEGCNLSALLEVMQDQFSHEPPLYAKPRTIPSPAPGPSSRTPPQRPPLPPKPGHAFATPTHTPSSSISSPHSQVLRSTSTPTVAIHPPPPPPPPVPPHPFHSAPHAIRTNMSNGLTYAPQVDSSSSATFSPNPSTHNSSHTVFAAPLPVHPRSSTLPPLSAVQSPQPPLPPPLPPHPQLPALAQPQYYTPPSSRPVLPSVPPPNFIDGEPELGSIHGDTSPAPPRPPNPETLRFHAQVHERLTSELNSLSHAMALDAERLRAHQTDLLAGEPAIRDEMARLEAVRDVCRNVSDRTRRTVVQAESNIAELRRKGEPEVDELVCATSIVHDQLINLVAEDNAIEDTIYHLHRALNTGRIDLEKFIRATRALAEEQFMKRALIDKIQVGLATAGINE